MFLVYVKTVSKNQANLSSYDQVVKPGVTLCVFSMCDLLGDPCWKSQLGGLTKKITAVMTQDGCCHVYLICKHDQADLNK